MRKAAVTFENQATVFEAYVALDIPEGTSGQRITSVLRKRSGIRAAAPVVEMVRHLVLAECLGCRVYGSGFRV